MTANDASRRVNSAVEIGTVSKVDHKLHRYRVKIGELETDWIPKTLARSGKTKTYESLDEGEQVVLVAPSGDLSQAVIVGSVATEETQSGTKGSEHRTVYPDGTIVDYDDEAGGLKVALAAGRSSTTTVGGVTFVTSKDGVSIKVGAVTFVLSGDGLAITGGQVTHDGLNIGSTHVHGGIIVGPSDTQGPH